MNNSLKVSTLLTLTASSMDTWRNLASTIPENHPAARRGCNVVTGATKNAVMAEYIFEPESSEPANARPPVSNMNVVMLVWIFIPLISANAKIITKIAGIENSMSLPTGIFPFFLIGAHVLVEFFLDVPCIL